MSAEVERCVCSVTFRISGFLWIDELLSLVELIRQWRATTSNKGSTALLSTRSSSLKSSDDDDDEDTQMTLDWIEPWHITALLTNQS